MKSSPSHHLAIATKLYSNVGQMVEKFRAERGVDLPRWPNWCFMPMAAWYAIVCDGNNVHMLPPNLVPDVGRLAALGTWRYSQGIYRVDRNLLAALADSEIAGPLPSDVFFRLPEWCIYVEMAGFNWIDSPLRGFFAHLEWDANTERTELRLLIDCIAGLLPMPLHIGEWTVAEAVERTLAETKQQAKLLGMTTRAKDYSTAGLAEQLKPLVSVLLYLCSEAPEVDNTREPGVFPSRPKPKKTKKGLRLFPAKGPTLWEVGGQLGEKLRDANLSEEPTGRKVRTHFRRGHWHGYWRGKKTDENRRFEYKWLPPMIVGQNNDEQEEGD